MIRVVRDGNKIKISGHSVPDICAAISSIMYTSVNALLEYNKDCISYNDDGDSVKITILEHDDIIDMIVNNMFNMFKDVDDTKKYVKVVIK